MMSVRKTQMLRGELRENEPMSRHTTWRVGGPAKRYYRPADLDDLVEFIRRLPEDEPLYWIGLGSNLLVRDGGVGGTVIATSGMLNEMTRLDENRVRVESGVSCALVARFCAREGLAGAEFLSGIPGTMGGAIRMNAGCFGGETWQLIEQVETVDHMGVVRTRMPSEYRVGYRHVEAPLGEWFVAAQLKLEQGDSGQLQNRIRELLDLRGSSQPTRLPNAGSVFRNPEGDYAARLIEASELKGRCIGGACVSEKHANFIVNNGGATATEIEMLIELVQNDVELKHGIRLQREVHIIGERKGSAV
jgi:UDP-N-acetylmuramate dehydrogenase